MPTATIPKYNALVVLMSLLLSPLHPWALCTGSWTRSSRTRVLALIVLGSVTIVPCSVPVRQAEKWQRWQAQ